MQDIRDLIVDAEDRLAAAGISVQAHCERAGINRATWQRWKAGKVKPSWEAWNRASLTLPAAPSRARAGRAA